MVVESYMDWNSFLYIYIVELQIDYLWIHKIYNSLTFIHDYSAFTEHQLYTRYYAISPGYNVNEGNITVLVVVKA